jgi:hypothetical protein
MSVLHWLYSVEWYNWKLRSSKYKEAPLTCVMSFICICLKGLKKQQKASDRRARTRTEFRTWDIPTTSRNNQSVKQVYLQVSEKIFSHCESYTNQTALFKTPEIRIIYLRIQCTAKRAARNIVRGHTEEETFPVTFMGTCYIQSYYVNRIYISHSVESKLRTRSLFFCYKDTDPSLRKQPKRYGNMIRMKLCQRVFCEMYRK